MEIVRVIKASDTKRILKIISFASILLLGVLSLLIRNINIIFFFLLNCIVTWLIVFFALKNRKLILYTDCFEILHVFKKSIIDYYDIIEISIEKRQHYRNFY